MEFKQLEVFAAVVDYSSFSEAARRLYLTQPTVSAHIHALEKELNSRLIIRTTRQLTVTERGRQLYDCAVQMLNMRNYLIEEFTGNQWKLIELSASTIPSSYLLPELLGTFAQNEANIHFRVSQSDSEDAVQKVLQGTVDLGLVGTRISSDTCEFLPFYQDSMVVATAVNERYLTLFRRGASFSDLLKEPFILREKGSGTKKELDLFLEKHNLNASDLNVVAHMNDLESIKKSIVSGLGISILSACSVKDLEKTKQILLFPLEESAHRRTFYLVYNKHRILKPHVRRFLRFVQHYYTTL
ncbi:MAG: selenium metabolism-associated LysR family transcriptional regulator [Lachnospiraceae bacterium]|nr:selenium metabolism-associated LysR family transcriptional regulator [Lachnospiraceae bacterium]